MNANDILRAIERRHYDGALCRELVLNSPPEIGINNRRTLDRVARLHGVDSSYYKRIFEGMAGQDIADVAPPNWKPLPVNRRIDGLLYAKQRLIAIEVKVSVADFRRETEEKRAPWEEVTNQFVYATPKGLLNPTMIPKHCGLWEIDDRGGVVVVKKAKVNKEPKPMPQQIVVSLMYRSRKG